MWSSLEGGEGEEGGGKGALEERERGLEVLKEVEEEEGGGKGEGEG